MIDRETIDRIFAAANIVDIVGDYVTLKRRGANYQACCPFHQEKTPSFVVSPSRGIYKCFGCGKAGNAVNFIMESESVSYPEALKMLAKRYGIEVREEAQTEEDIARNNNRESMFALNQWAADYFQRYMYNEDEGRAVALTYFSSLRGFSDATIRKFGLGFCPSRGNRFSDDARSAGYKPEFLLSTGLSLQRDGSSELRDRFYDRVIFPVHNVSGRVVAFGGRTLRTDKKVAKYQNSPESEIYSKSRELYGLFFAKKAIQQEDRVIMVEGYADVISMHQAGVENVVASSGTSLTEEQIRLVGRFTNNITLMYDGDPAGVKASMRGVDLILKEGMNVRIVLLPEEHDPDTFARAHTSEELRDYITREAQDFLGFKARLLLGDAKDPMQRSEAIRAMVESVSLIPDNIKRQEYVKYCAEIMQTSVDTLTSEVALVRAGVRAGREGQDFVRRHQAHEAQREREEQMPIQQQHSGPERVISDASVGTSMYTLEKEIVKYLLKYGHLNFSVLDEQTKEYFDYNVAEHIFTELDADGLTLSIPVFSELYNEYHAEFDRQGVGVEVSVHTFVNHHNPEVSRMAVDLLTSDDNYQISRIWEQKDVHNESVQEQLADGVPSVVSLFKWRTVDQRISELRKRLATPGLPDEEMSSVLAALTKFLAVRGMLANVTKRLI
ncbi:MAG: DNA primase [Alistipes sp.]|nr:DNA primase [Alistipes sp.]